MSDRGGAASLRDSGGPSALGLWETISAWMDSGPRDRAGGAPSTQHERTEATGQRVDPLVPPADLAAKLYSGLVSEGALSPTPSCDRGGGRRWEKKGTDRWAV